MIEVESRHPSVITFSLLYNLSVEIKSGLNKIEKSSLKELNKDRYFKTLLECGILKIESKEEKSSSKHDPKSKAEAKQAPKAELKPPPQAKAAHVTTNRS